MDSMRCSLLNWAAWARKPKLAPYGLEMAAGSVVSEDLQRKSKILAPNSNYVSSQFSVEDYRAGYPQFSALIAANEHFFISRRFLRLRARVLLAKQDRLFILEGQLDQVDQEETLPLFLGKSRSDKNTQCGSLLAEIELCLADYDSFAASIHHTLSLAPAQPRDVLSLQNWVGGTSSLSRDETAYLNQERELMTLASPNDHAMKKFEDWVEDQFVRHKRGIREV
ncbi:hypothetical protein MMC25_004956 [Agyrium rufum]|nr:hypothetical protein [Agyrium rufum]